MLFRLGDGLALTVVYVTVTQSPFRISGLALYDRLSLLSVLVVFIAMALSFLSVSFRSYLKNWRYFGVKMFGNGRDVMGRYEQIRVLTIDTTVPFYT